MRLNNLTSLRFFAALCIFLHHLSILGYDVPRSLGNVPLAMGVSFFYVLSGFVLAYAYKEKRFTFAQSAAFSFVRFFRLWPLHVVCTAFALLMNGIPTDVTSLYLYITLQHSWIPTFRTAFLLNSVSWSISVELFFYIVFSFMLTMTNRSKIIVISVWSLVLVAFVFAAGMGIISLDRQGPNFNLDRVTDWSFFQLFPPVRIIEFFAGIVAHRLYMRVQLTDRNVVLLQLAALALLIVNALSEVWLRRHLWPYLPLPALMYLGQTDMFPVFMLLIFAFAYQSGLVSRILSGAFLVYLGDISFAFYMTHQLILKWVARSGWFSDKSPLFSVVAAFFLAVIVSMMLHRFVELPCLNWAKRRFLPERRHLCLQGEHLPTP